MAVVCTTTVGTNEEFFASHRCHDDDDNDDNDDHEQNVRWLQRKVRCIRMKYKETPAADKFLELRLEIKSDNLRNTDYHTKKRLRLKILSTLLTKRSDLLKRDKGHEVEYSSGIVVILKQTATAQERFTRANNSVNSSGYVLPFSVYSRSANLIYCNK
ncbi:hypothetical protein V1478_006092 [Vespula squamosa]|uniref:Uncharacterized protein n=1 Tax=Vespula squamosa TaxID=30214 RepID=A0ABD2B6X0_VESSQ